MCGNLIPVGYICTPYNSIEECPFNIDFAGPECKLVIEKEYLEGINGLTAGQNILILYWLEKADRTQLSPVRKGDEGKEKKGCFAKRSPHRPNPIGVALTPVVRIEDNEITVRGLDCLNGTKLLDIKPAIKMEND